MPLTLSEKQTVVAELAEVAASAYSAVAAEYRGLSAGEMDQLRAQARETGVYVRVVKNTLARRALADTEFSCMEAELSGPLVLAFSQDGPSAAARLIQDFSKEHKKLAVKMVSIGGRVLGPSEIDMVAAMPTYEQAISMLMALMKAPVEKLARTINELPGKLVRTIAAIRDQKQAA